MLKLLIVGFYYFIRPRPLPYSPLPHLWLIILLLAVVVGGWWNVEKTHENQLLSYSPTLFSAQESSDLTTILFAAGDYELALRYYEAENKIRSPQFGWPTEVERQLNSNHLLIERLRLAEEQLAIYPTSRDLWLYKGWLSYLLRDKEKIREASDKLTLLDPNHPAVREFLEKAID